MSDNEEEEIFGRLLSQIATRVKAYYRTPRIKIEQVPRLAEALRGNSTLRLLHLYRNDLGDDGVALLAGSLLTNSSLTYLGLVKNDFGDKGARSLAAALPFNSTLAHLVLRGNNIGDKGASALAKGLLDNSTVNTLCLAGNDIGNNGARALLESLLCGNSTLTQIRLLEMNGMDANLRDMVNELLEINRGAQDREEALKLKMEWLVGSPLPALERGTEEVHRIRVEAKIGWLVNSKDSAEDRAAVSLALREIGSFPRADQRRRIIGRLLGSPKHGERVASSVGEIEGRAMYRKATECGAAPKLLMKLLRAHPSLFECRDVNDKLYPFMLLATMLEEGVDEVMELLLQSPTLVQSGIGGSSEQ